MDSLACIFLQQPMRLLILISALFFCCESFAQDSTAVKNVADTLVIDTAVVTAKVDSVKPVIITPSFDSCRNYILHNLVRLNLFGKPEFYIEKEKQVNERE